jgi:phosphopentomutase
MKVKRVVILVLDSVGVGALPDAAKYGDKGCNTLGNTARAVSGLNLPHLYRLGLGNIIAVEGVPAVGNPLASFGKMAEKSSGKDTTTGHWELAGLILNRSFPVYPDGFPPEVISTFEKQTGRKVLGNKAASGTAIIEELGPRHIETGFPIVYTSADSVFQIAAHEKIIPVAELYAICRIAREILVGEHAVGRVIARPFEGLPGSFRRTERRHDFSLTPPGKTVLDLLKENSINVTAVGKIKDIFDGKGISNSIHTKGNMDGVDQLLKILNSERNGLIFINLVDFDMLYGHRNDVRGYARALEKLDGRLPEIFNLMRDDDIIIFTADHGCDPTAPGTDHTREYVPLLVYGRPVYGGINLGVRETFADMAATVADIFGFEFGVGRSFWSQIRRK